MGFCTMVSMEVHGWPRLATFLHPSSLLQAFLKPLFKEFSWDLLTFFESGRSQENFLSLPNIQDQQALQKETEEFNIEFKCKWTIPNLLGNIEQYNCCTIDSGRSSSDCDNFSWHLGFFPKLLGCGATRPNKCGGCEGAPGGCQLCNGAAGCAQSPGGGAGRKGSLRMAKPLTVQCQQTCSHDTNGLLWGKDDRKTMIFSHEIRGFPVMFPFN